MLKKLIPFVAAASATLGLGIAVSYSVKASSSESDEGLGEVDEVAHNDRVANMPRRNAIVEALLNWRCNVCNRDFPTDTIHVLCAIVAQRRFDLEKS